MSFGGDLRRYKTELRQKYKDVRSSMSADERCRIDTKIFNRLINLWQFRENSLILTYVSSPIEVDTRRLIAESLSRGKSVAVPRCIDGTRDMEFRLITSFYDLAPRSFGILEPSDDCPLVGDISQSLCIVPALSFDPSGYRLGFGKGYYDRFLSTYSGFAVGICYNACLEESLPHGKYDRKVSMLVTESKIINP